MNPASDLPPDHIQHLQNLLNSAKQSILDQHNCLLESERRNLGIEEEQRVAMESAEQRRQLVQVVSEIESLILQLVTDQDGRVREIVRRELQQQEASAGGNEPEIANLREKINAIDTLVRDVTEEVRAGFRNLANANNQRLEDSIDRLGVKVDGANNNVLLQIQTCFRQCTLMVEEIRADLLKSQEPGDNVRASAPTTMRDAAVGNEGPVNEANPAMANGESNNGSPPAASGDGDGEPRAEQPNPPEIDSDDDSLYEVMPRTQPAKKNNTPSFRYQRRGGRRRRFTHRKAKRQGVTGNSSSTPSSTLSSRKRPAQTTNSPRRANSGHPKRKRKRTEVEQLVGAANAIAFVFRSQRRH